MQTRSVALRHPTGLFLCKKTKRGVISKMNDDDMNDGIDLGSEAGEDFDPFADADELAEEVTEDVTEQPSAEPEAKAPAPKPPKSATNSAKTDKSANPLENAINDVENKDIEKAMQSIYEKPPVFDYAGAKENIEDASQTFEELRIAKAADFPELDDGKRVSWTAEYGKITKTVSNPKGTSIGKIKSEIETSTEFIEALRKAKDKNPDCKIKPRVTAQSKGAAPSGYKGVFTNISEVEAAGKTISILPARDGKVYEIRKNNLGSFTTVVGDCELLSDVQAGFAPASGIPLIPMDLIIKIISFFRYYTRNGDDNEVLVNIYWDKQNKEFIVDTPAQMVSNISVHSNENPEYIDERYIHYMDIHSHNRMRAFFSTIDDSDEKATRLYTVIGRLDKYLPEIKTRFSNGGKFLEIDPGEVFELIGKPFPPEWRDKVSLRKPHKDVESIIDTAFPVNKCCFDMYENADFSCTNDSENI
jgi:PRTRC genetic system protein A